MRQLYFSLFISTSLMLSGQQKGWQKEIKTPTQDFLSDVSITPDRQYLLSGSSIRPAAPGTHAANNGFDYRIVKLGMHGSVLWEKYFSGLRHDYLTATGATREGGFLLAGTSDSPRGLDKKGKAYGSTDLWLIKITEGGNEEWQQTLGTPAAEEAKAVIESADEGYFVAASVRNHRNGFGGKDGWIIKLDRNGKPVAQLYLGGSGHDEPESLIPTRDGGCLVALYSRSGETPDRETEPQEQPQEEDAMPAARWLAKKGENYGEGDYWLVKLDKDLNLQWQKSFGGSGDDHIRKLAHGDSGYLVIGESRSGESGNKTVAVKKDAAALWAIALNEEGEELWQKSYAPGTHDLPMSLQTVRGKDGRTKGFLVGGYSRGEGKAAKGDETFWILYLDTQGEEQWLRYEEGKSRKKKERLSAARLTADGYYLLAGTATAETGAENWKIIKTGDSLLEALVEKQDIRVYPNPVKDYCYVEIGLDFEEAELALYDLSGKQLQYLKTKNPVTKINTASLSKGVYMVTATTETKTVNTKIVKR